MKLQFDCVFYYVKDLESAIRFYSEILGMSMTSRDAVARFDVDGVLLELVPAPDPSQLMGNGNARLCLKVADLDEAASDLRAMGVAVSRVRVVESGRLASIEDPDGNELLLWQYS